MNFIRRYWFGSLMFFIIGCFLLLFVLLIISPKQDAKGRGFIKCTQEMVDNLSTCNKKFYCSIMAVIKNTTCDVDVVIEGISLWIDKKQPTPWSNYIFEPQTDASSFFDEEERAEYLKANPDVNNEMKRLDMLRKDLENEENEQSLDKEMLPEE